MNSTKWHIAAPKFKNVFAQLTITIQNKHNLSIAKLVSLRAQVKKEAHSVSVSMKNLAVFSSVKSANAYFTTSQKIISVRECQHKMIKNLNDTVMI